MVLKRRAIAIRQPEGALGAKPGLKLCEHTAGRSAIH